MLYYLPCYEQLLFYGLVFEKCHLSPFDVVIRRLAFGRVPVVVLSEHGFTTVNFALSVLCEPHLPWQGNVGLFSTHGREKVTLYGA